MLRLLIFKGDVVVSAGPERDAAQKKQWLTMTKKGF